MQDDKGIRRALTVGRIYSLFQTAVGADSAKRWLAQDMWRCVPGSKVVDVGCGTGDALRFLPPNVRYVGFDISEPYIKLATERYGDRGTFIVGNATSLLAAPDKRLENADLVICNGLLHHLDDREASDVFKLASHILTPTGRLVCFEPTFLVHQTLMARWLMRQDRGKNVRTDLEWLELGEAVFPHCRARIATGLYLIPYTHIIMDCRFEGSAFRPRQATTSHAP